MPMDNMLAKLRRQKEQPSFIAIVLSAPKGEAQQTNSDGKVIASIPWANVSYIDPARPFSVQKMKATPELADRLREYFTATVNESLAVATIESAETAVLADIAYTETVKTKEGQKNQVVKLAVDLIDSRPLTAEEYSEYINALSDSSIELVEKLRAADLSSATARVKAAAMARTG